MRICVVAICVGILVGELFAPRHATAMLPQTRLSAIGKNDNLQRVEDTCWWWGTRWQYGWRGYGWYPCWDWTKPQPNVVAPETVPESAVEQSEVQESCIKRWRDNAGLWHARRIC
jgi:hypothetical protein